VDEIGPGAAGTAALDAWIARREAVLDGVRATLIEVLHLGAEPDELDPDTPLFGAGLRLDSIDTLDLVVSLEARFGVQVVEWEEQAPGTLRTLNTIVDHLLAAPPGAAT
jgi:acyl carrier protein